MIDKNKTEGIDINTTDDMFLWTAKIKGPKNSPYENGTFELLITFNEQYPIKPPSIKFLNPKKIFHPNIYTDGKICVDILQSQWAPVLNVLKVLISLRSLLEDPNPNSPANRNAAILYVNDREAYNNKVIDCINNN